MAALLELDDVHARYGPVEALHGVTPGGARGRGRRRARRQRRRQDDDAARRVGHGAALGRRDPVRRRSACAAGPEAAAKAGIAHVPEGRGTFTELSVIENLRLGAYTRRDREVKQDVERVAGWFPWLASGPTSRPGRSRAASSRCSPWHAR